MTDQMPAELGRLIKGLHTRLDTLETRAKKVQATPVTKASGQFNLPQVDATNPPAGTVSIHSEDGHFRIVEDDGDVIEFPAANVTNWGGITAATASGTVTAAQFNDLRSDVIAVGNKLNSLLTSFRNAGQIA